MSADNLSIWKRVQKTDPKYTKPFKRSGGFSGTAINATWLTQQATEVFGPCGIGWGVNIANEGLLDGAEGVKVHRVQIELWYILDGVRGSISHFGQTEFCGKRSNGNWYTDEEAPKKSLTDAMTKALSLLGFASDVHLGLFDDNKYVNNLRAEFKAEPSKPAAESTIPPEPIKDPGPGPITSGNILPIKSSAQAKRDGDWAKIEATLKDAAEQQSFAAMLAWPIEQSDLLSRVSLTWRGEAEEVWRASLAALMATECQNAGEVNQFGVDYYAAIKFMPDNYIQACREVMKDALRHHRGQPQEARA